MSLGKTNREIRRKASRVWQEKKPRRSRNENQYSVQGRDTVARHLSSSNAHSTTIRATLRNRHGESPVGGDLPPQSQARTVAGRSRAWYGRGSQCRRESGRASSLDERGRFRGPGASWRCERGALFPIHSNENTTVLSGKQHQKKARGGNAAPVPAGPRSAPTRSDCEGMVVWLFTSGK